MFKVTGKVAGRPAEVTWDARKLSGDPRAVMEAETAARGAEGFPIGPVCGPYTHERHLSDPLSALHILLAVFDEGAEINGDVPEPPEMEEGEIP